MSKSFIILSTALVLLLVGLNSFVYADKAKSVKTASTGKAQIGGAFELTSHKGNIVTDKNFKGKKMMVFFGFANCPAICPTGLSNISQVIDILGEKSSEIAPVFITIDPERDSVAALDSYMENFHESITALTGPQAEINKAIENYKVYSRKVEIEGGYTMDHSAYIYLMDEDGEYLAHFAHDEDAEQIATKVKRFL